MKWGGVWGLLLLAYSTVMVPQQIMPERIVHCTIDPERSGCTEREKKEARRWVLYAGAVALGLSGLGAAIYAAIKYGLGREQMEQQMAHAIDNFDQAADQLAQAKETLDELSDVQHTEKLVVEQIVAQTDQIQLELQQLKEDEKQ